MKYSVDSIRERYNSGEEMRFIFFWGHTADRDRITKACLSQWFPCYFEVDGVRYHTAEQYMMAQKAMLFHDEEAFRRIMAADNPKDYKALGRLVNGFTQALWDEAKYGIVLKGSLAKFSQNTHLREYLLGTGESVLAEASPYDGIWGVKLHMDDALIQNPNNWRGENLLGCALMETRDILLPEGGEQQRWRIHVRGS